MLRESRENYISTICSLPFQNPKRFWSFFRTKTKTLTIPNIVYMKLNATERQSADNDVDIANTFNTYFALVFTHNSDIQHFGQQFTETNFVLDDITTSNSWWEVAGELKHLDNNKAHGPDGIPARLLTETAFEIAPSLCALFNKSLRSGTIPDDWKLATIVPVHKRGEKSHVENYRSISLLSLISKVLERCVLNNIKHHVY